MAIDLVEKIERGLPNGLHDASIHRITLNYSERTIVFDLSVWVGDLESTDEAEREKLRDGVLAISGFEQCVIQAPDPDYPFASARSLTISSGAGNPANIQLFKTIPEDAFAHWFFCERVECIYLLCFAWSRLPV